MSYLIVFTLGYLLGGMTALLVLGLTLAARRGDRGSIQPVREANRAAQLKHP